MVFEEVLGHLLNGGFCRMIRKIKIKETVKFTALLLMAALFFSCVSTRTLVIDIPLPAENALPPSIQSFTLVSQSVNENYTDLDSDSLQKIFYKQRFNFDTVVYDLQMADTTMKALGELLFESGRFDYVIPESRFLESPKTSLFATEMPWEEVNDLCETFETDAVLSLDHLKTRVFTEYDNETFFDPFQGGFLSAATADMKIYYEALFRIYDPEEEKILLREFISDTLYWGDSDATARDLFSRFTPVKQALTETGIALALELSEKIAVRWKPERRTYFVTGNAGLKQGNRFASQGDWLMAVSQWKKTADETGSKALKSKAQLNMALGYEMLGDVDSAIQWALKSYNIMYRPLTYEYLQILKRRKSELKETK
ncbi:hypothetical protein D1164_20730 [Mariniphaga sediminis]|uniref:Uncharacterized protein n=2 Tax=Mariniphaga sediminis TaxID=1628158 RepID=A0A399CYY2_9BACT|nr:hypothetical protein D1164_20730 [Mariniphaga sediminis]